ncbi:MAG: hypothetical protein U0270_17100 [Labilithrix sp.]
MHELLGTYGESALVGATARGALRQRCFGAEYVAHHLDLGAHALAEAAQQETFT